MSNDIPVETMRTHSLRNGGKTAMFRECYGFLEVKEWVRWKPPSFHGHLWYDMQTTRHVGGKMAVSTGLLDFTTIKPSDTRVLTFRAAWKNSVTPQPQSSLPAKCTIPARDISNNLTNDIRKAIHLWRLVDNPDKTEIEDLRNFDNSNDVLCGRKGSLFVKELLELGNFHLARKVVMAHNRRNKNESRELPVVEFDRLRRALESLYTDILLQNHFAIDQHMNIQLKRMRN